MVKKIPKAWTVKGNKVIVTEWDYELEFKVLAIGFFFFIGVCKAIYLVYRFVKKYLEDKEEEENF
jgi:hypothetical protein